MRRPKSIINKRIERRFFFIFKTLGDFSAAKAKGAFDPRNPLFLEGHFGPFQAFRATLRFLPLPAARFLRRWAAPAGHLPSGLPRNSPAFLSRRPASPAAAAAPGATLGPPRAASGGARGRPGPGHAAPGAAPSPASRPRAPAPRKGRPRRGAGRAGRPPGRRRGAPAPPRTCGVSPPRLRRRRGGVWRRGHSWTDRRLLGGDVAALGPREASGAPLGPGKSPAG